MTGLGDLVRSVHDSFDPDAALRDVAYLCGLDRHQASDGIWAAASYVAERAEKSGLVDVEVLRFPPGARWWTFDAPVGWSPVRASLDVAGAPALRYPDQPYGLAVHSAARDDVPVTVAVWPDVGPGALVVLPEPGPVPVAALVAGGAAGFVADPLGGRLPGEVGRIELLPGAALAGFSVTAPVLLAYERAAGASGRLTVELGPPYDMPVVTGRTPGAYEDGELLLSAHLCHPRPSANDNASGVAALLGLAPVLAARPGRAVRFVWGPEFTGLAAYLHDRVHAGLAPRPVAAVNVDMAGESVGCGGMLVVERVPDELPGLLSAVAERCAALVPAPRSYSGAAPAWPWTATPFTGASDHVVLTGPPTSCPTVGLGHWPDRYNHTSADTLDRVDPAELRRTAAVAGSALAALREPALAGELLDVVFRWAARRLADDGADVPYRLEIGRAAVESPRGIKSSGIFVDLSSDQLADITTRLTALAESLITESAQTESVVTERLAPHWPGPVNLRSLLADARPADRDRLDAELAADRGGGYARVLALLRACDGRRDRAGIVRRAALSAELPIAPDFADLVLDLACRAGWLVPEGAR